MEETLAADSEFALTYIVWLKVQPFGWLNRCSPLKAIGRHSLSTRDNSRMTFAPLPSNTGNLKRCQTAPLVLLHAVDALSKV